jgi:hypothetical protein
MELLTTDEFGGWFVSLADRDAEDVAATLEVIAELGVEREAPGSSEWLTWYEHPSLSEGRRALSPFFNPGMKPDAGLVRFVHEWGAFHGYAKRVVAHLESRAFAARLSQLDPRDAALVTDAITRIKKAVTRRSLAVSDFHVKRRLGTRALTPKEEAEAAKLVDVEEIRAGYLAALSAAGFTAADVPAHSPALREIAVRVPAPGFRLLYGVDVRNRRALVVLGEPFDRSFYGHSVRHAEHVWREFLAGQPTATRPARRHAQR